MNYNPSRSKGFKQLLLAEMNLHTNLGLIIGDSVNLRDFVNNSIPFVGDFLFMDYCRNMIWRIQKGHDHCLHFVPSTRSVERKEPQKNRVDLIEESIKDKYIPEVSRIIDETLMKTWRGRKDQWHLLEDLTSKFDLGKDKDYEIVQNWLIDLLAEDRRVEYDRETSMIRLSKYARDIKYDKSDKRSWSEI